jgi:dienelactone hydrolase
VRFDRWLSVSLVAAALLAASATGLLRAGQGTERHLTVSGVPLVERHPGAEAPQRRPGVVVAHGYAGSATLMAQFGDTLSAAGFVVVLLDFTGHGANPRRLPGSGAPPEVLRRDLDVAVAHLRGLPDVDPARIALVGHSMGASAVTDYAVAHPDLTATVAISLPSAEQVTAELPSRLLLLVGGLEFAGFRTAASVAAEAGGPDREQVVVPGTEHITILYARRTHQETAAWLAEAFGAQSPAGGPASPVRRVAGAGLLLLALLIGLYPVARLLLGGARGPAAPRFGLRVVVVAAAATVAGALLAPLLPNRYLPLAIGDYVVGFTAVTGVAILLYLRVRPRLAMPSERLLLAAPLLTGYAAVTIALPMQLGLTQAVPVGARWWLLPLVWAGFAVLTLAGLRLSDGNSLGLLVVSAIAVVVLTAASMVGLTSGFVLLVVPLLAVLFVLQAAWSAVLHRLAAPAWLIAVVTSLLVAWPIATALPLA